MGRRRLSWVARLVALVSLGVLIAPVAHAQDATSQASPTGTAEIVRSVTREEYAQRLVEQFPMEEAARTGGRLIWGESSDITTLNGLVVDSLPTGYITSLIYEPLVGISVINGTIVPALADFYEIAGDGVTYTFHLNRDARWHDGQDLTAEDVAFSFDTMLNPDFNSFVASGIEGVLESYRVIDEHTFEMVSKGRRATFLYEAVIVVPTMPRHVWVDVAPADWPTDPGSTGEDPSRVVGTGPFTFVDREFGTSVTLARNEAYWDTVTGRVPYIDELIFRVLPDSNAAVQELIAGGTDLLDAVAPGQVESVRNAGIEVAVYPTLAFSFYALQLDPARTTLFQDVAVRQALFTALDRELIVETIYAGFGEVAVGTQSNLSPAYAPARIDTVYEYDPERARELLADAGWTDTDGNGIVDKDGQELSFTMIAPTDDPGDQLLAYFQDAWTEIGVEMTPELIPYESLTGETGALATGDFEALILAFVWNPDGGQGLLFSCDGSINLTGYCSARYDELEEAQLTETDPERRLELLIEQANIVNEDLPLGIFRFAQGRTAFNPRLHNLHPNGYSPIWSLPWVWLDE